MRPPPIITVTPRTITPTLGTTSPKSIQRQLITIARWPNSTPRRPTNTRKNSSRNRCAEQSWRRFSRGQRTYLAPVEIGRRLAPYLCRDEPRHACRYEFHAPSASNWSSPRDHGSAWAYPVRAVRSGRHISSRFSQSLSGSVAGISSFSLTLSLVYHSLRTYRELVM